MSRWQRLTIYVLFTTMSRSQRLFGRKVNKHLDPLTCHRFTWHVDLDDSDLALSRYQRLMDLRVPLKIFHASLQVLHQFSLDFQDFVWYSRVA